VRIICNPRIITACACLLATGLLARADAAQLGTMKADKILFLGNSITACEQNAAGEMWGLTASTADKDYAHLLVGKINEKTKGSLTMIPTTMPYTNADGSIAQNGSNVVNIADAFERSYGSYSAAKFATQFAMKPDIVVLQFCENIPNTAENPFDATAFTNGLRSLLNDLRENSNPEIFVTSWILGDPRGVDSIKRALCAEDPTHRTFVDLTNLMYGANLGAHGHPSDVGMAVIADRVFSAMAAHSVPEPTSLVLWSTALVAVVCYAWKKRI
jgi:hypothetical protein